MSATTKIILDTRRMKKKTGKYPVKLRVIFKGVCKDYQTNFDLSKEDFEKLNSSRVSNDLQHFKLKLKELRANAEIIITHISPFDFIEFEKKFIVDHNDLKERKLHCKIQDTVNSYKFDEIPFVKRFPIFKEDHSIAGSISIVFCSYIKKLLEEDRIGTALTYQDSFNSIKKFRGNVMFTHITVSFLNQYEKWMKERGRSKSTVGIKLRALRCIFNEAIEEGIIKREKCYPFGKRKYIIPLGTNTKKALNVEELKQIYYDKPTCPNEQKGKDFWLFMYFANGMNPKDFAHLKNKNIHGEYIEFVRAKTEFTARRDPKTITIFINEEMSEIIKKWRNTDKHPDTFLFPILARDMSTLEKHYIVRTLVKYINDRMKSISKRLNIQKKITTIVSRHSFSTQLKRSGVSTEYIQEALGHTDLKTTENYLDSFTHEVKKLHAGLLTSFKEIK